MNKIPEQNNKRTQQQSEIQVDIEWSLDSNYDEIGREQHSNALNNGNTSQQSANLLEWLSMENGEEDRQRDTLMKNINKLGRNRVAAKESRKRKKNYIQQLEHSIQDLQQHLHRMSREIKECLSEIKKHNVSDSPIMNDVDGRIQHVFVKVQRICAEGEGEDNDQELNMCMDSICYRLGAVGKERKGQVDQFYKQLVNLSVPPLHRYLFWSAQAHTHLFAFKPNKDSREAEWFRSTSILLNSHALDKKFLTRKRSQLVEGRKDMLRFIGKLNCIKSHFQTQGANLDDMFLTIRDILTPRQSAKFILLIQKNKFRQQLNFHQRFSSEGSQEKRMALLQKQYH